MKKRIIATIFALVLLFGCSLPVAANNLPNTSFTHHDNSDGSKTVVAIPDIYEAVDAISARSLGLEEGFEKIADLAGDQSGNLYLLTSDSRVLKIDADGQLICEISVSDSDGEQVDYSEAGGFYVANDGTIYIADTVNARVLAVAQDGKLIRTIEKPDSAILPENFDFAPFAVEMDSKGVLYVLSDGAYYGALLFNPQDEFIGFYGANTVNASPLTALKGMWDRLTKNDTKRKYSVKKLPYQFLDLYIDDTDFVYTCTGRTTSGTSAGQLRKLSPSGTNILYKTQWDGTKIDASAFNFGEIAVGIRNNKNIAQNFVSVQVDENGFIYGLDSTYGIIYVYDTDCTLLAAFGGGRGNGDILGTFSEAVDLCYMNQTLYVADASTCMVTVFEPTEFGKSLLSARAKTLSSHYIDAEPEWQQVLNRDAGNRMAYCGLAKAAFWKENYRDSMDYAEKGFDFVTYGQAKEKIGSEFIRKNFFWLFLGVILVLAVLAFGISYTVKHQIKLVKNEEIRLLFGEFAHPFNTFRTIKEKKKGSVVIASILLFLLLISAVVSENYSNFRYTTFNAATSNSLFQLLRTVGFAALAIVANWGVCVLLEGKGKLKEIFLAVSYALLPLIISNFVCTVASYLITSPESTLINAIHLIAWIVAGIIATIGLMIMHEYSLSKFLAAVLLTVFGIILVVFIIFMLGMLVNQLWTFISTLFMEAVYR